MAILYSIEVHNEQKNILVDQSEIEKIVCKILKKYKVERAELSIVIVTDRKIHEVNRKFLNHDFSTDVITFDLSDKETSRQKGSRVKEIEGEIFVSAVTARRKAQEFNISSKQELLLYIIHGILHLLGYDDHTAIDRNMMRKKEKEVLNFIKEAQAQGSSSQRT